ncbi:MAG TPA: hypothetical protein VLS25_08130, partial [Dehalococcoidia bacterium]|nr:hypothetical protein [Dehalococcoidia bacterium]
STAPYSDNRVEILDVTSFLAPVRRIDTSPGNPAFSARYDLEPGRGVLTEYINVVDLARLITFAPPMLGVRAFGGPSCPYPP